MRLFRRSTGRIAQVRCTRPLLVLIMSLVELCDEYGVEFLQQQAGRSLLNPPPSGSALSSRRSLLNTSPQSDKIKRGQASAIDRGVFGFTSRHLAWHLAKAPENPTDKSSSTPTTGTRLGR